MLLPSLLGFALCFVCLAATTWAWFTASVTSEANTIQTAHFDVNVAVTATSGTVTDKGNNVYSLSAGTYTVTLTPTGNATKGFAVVEVAAAQPPSSQMLMLASAGDGEGQATPTDITAVGTYCTQQLFDENGVAQVATFTIQATGDVTLTVKAYWGEKQTDLVATPITATLTPLSNEAQLTNEEEDPADENQQEEEETSSNEQETPDGEDHTEGEPPAEGEGEQPSDPANGENGQQGGEQQGDEPSTPTEGEGEQQGGDPIVEGEPSSSNVGDNTGGEPSTGGETGESNVSADTADTADTTTPTVQSEVVPADPAPTE